MNQSFSDQATSHVSMSQEAPSTPSNHSSSLSRFILPTLVFALAVSTGLVSYQNLQLQKKVAELDAQLLTVVVASPSPTTQEAEYPSVKVATKTFTGKNSKITFDYPANWKVTEHDPVPTEAFSSTLITAEAPDTILDHGQLLSGKYLTVGIDKPTPQYNDLQGRLKLEESYGRTVEELTVGQQKGYLLIGKPEDEGYTFLFEKNNLFYTISWIPQTLDDAEINTIVYSFRLD